jgi:hypothetical protein
MIEPVGLRGSAGVQVSQCCPRSSTRRPHADAQVKLIVMRPPEFATEIDRGGDRKGIDRLILDADRLAPVVIEKSDVPANEPPDSDESLLEQEIPLVLEIVSLSFKPGIRWRLSNGERVFTAAMDDDAFFDCVKSGDESLRNGDVLRCRVRGSFSRGATARCMPTIGCWKSWSTSHGRRR